MSTRESEKIGDLQRALDENAVVARQHPLDEATGFGKRELMPPEMIDLLERVADYLDGVLVDEDAGYQDVDAQALHRDIVKALDSARRAE